MNKFKKQSALILSTILLSSGFTFMPNHVEVNAQEVSSVQQTVGADQKVINRFDVERSFQTVKILSENFGPRVTGTEAEKQAAHFLKKELESYGYKVTEQSFSIPDKLAGEISVSNAKEVLANIPAGSAATDEEGITAPIFDAKLGYAEDFTADAEGKIALISRGDITFTEKIMNAIEAGAIAAFIYDNTDNPTPLSMSLGDYESSIPVAGITKESGEMLLTDIARTNETVTFHVDRMENITSQNLIVTRTPKHVKNPTIVHVTAHYDSVPFSPGANDNASGTSVVLELARILKSYPISKEVRFVFFGAEEIGLLGSQHYVNQLTEDEKARSIANFNLDMVGTDWEKATSLFTNTVDGKANLVTETAYSVADRIGLTSPLTLYQRGSSDHVSFHEAGIPAANFIRRQPGTAALEPYYHTPNDTIAHISKERLMEAGTLVGVSVYDIIKK